MSELTSYDGEAAVNLASAIVIFSSGSLCAFVRSWEN